MSRWELSEEGKKILIPIIKKFIDDAESDPRKCSDSMELDLSDLGFNPYQIWQCIEKDFLYEQSDLDENGWQQDFWITFVKEGKKDLVIDATGMIFQVILRAGCRKT